MYNALMCNTLMYFNPTIILATENHMGPKEAYKTFKKELLEKLKFPADQPNFIAWLKEKGVITDERTIKNLEMPYEAEGNRAIFILKEIHESLSISDTKFNNLLSLMEEYKQGLETLSRKIQSHLDPSMSCICV